MTAPQGKTVALIDPLWNGHHPMYFNQFTASFLRGGARVIGLCPDPAAARRNLLATGNPEGWKANTHFHPLPTGKRSFFNGRFEGDPVRTFDRWRKAADALADAEAACGWRADLVYFPYLDSYLRFLPFPQVPDVILNRPWSGLYLRNHHHGESPTLRKSLRLLAKGDAILRSRTSLGIGVLDERFIRPLNQLTRRPVTAYPDVTEGGLPETEFPLATEVRTKAKGRKIVGIIGLERRKGFLTLLRTAALAREAGLPIYFVCAGTYPPSDFTPAEQEEILGTAAGIASGTVDNLHFDPSAGRIAAEADFNSLFASFDIAWAAYEKFQGSSGTLSKAALFEIPCIATAGECIGQRIERYQMGLTIAEGSALDALAALRRLTGIDSGAPLAEPLYQNYRDDHSLVRLDAILAKLLAAV